MFLQIQLPMEPNLALQATSNRFKALPVPLDGELTQMKLQRRFLRTIGNTANFPSQSRRPDATPYRMNPILLTMFALAIPKPLAAEVVTISLPEPPTQIDLPDGWETDNLMDQWFQGWSPDRKVWVSGVVLSKLTKEQLLKWLPLHLDTFGVTAVIDAESLKTSEAEIAKRKGTEYRMTAEIEGTSQRIYVYAVPLAPDRIFILTTGGKPEDRAKHREAVDGILNSLRERKQEAKPATK